MNPSYPDSHGLMRCYRYRLLVNFLINNNWRIEISIFFDTAYDLVGSVEPWFVPNTANPFIPTNRVYDQVIRFIIQISPFEITVGDSL